MSIYTPVGCTADSPCPVMQFIHGGAWIFGNNYQEGMYDGTVLAKNYKVG